MQNSKTDCSNARTINQAAVRLVTFIALLCAGAMMATPSVGASEPGLRWDLDETPYSEQGLPRRVGSNLRDGVIVVVDSLVQGTSAGFAFFDFRRGGLLGQKLATFSGDVIGLVDANPVSKYVLRGVASRQLLRFGALAQPAPEQLATIFDAEFEQIPVTRREDYVGRSWFHTRAYTTPSVLVGLAGTGVSSLAVRPTGGLITILGFRRSGERLDAWGVDLVERSLAVPFL